MSLLLGCTGETPARPPNILLIVADDLGFDDLVAPPREDSATPNLDRLAAESTRFDRFFTAGEVCSPTRVSLLTGRYPQRFGFRYSPRGLPDEITTLPELLRDRGYATHHVGKWHVGSEPASVRPNAQGFDTFFGFLHARSLTPGGPGYFDPHLIRDEGERKVHPGHLTEILTEEAVQLVESASSETPWLINLWYFAPHAPIQPPGRRAGKVRGSGDTAYRDLIRAMDAGVGRILEALRATGQIDRTVIVFISDNGSPEPLHNQPFFGAKTQFFEGAMHVPFLMRMPGEAGPPRVDQVVSSLDLYPTLAALAGAELREAVDGLDLSPLLRGDSEALPARTLFWENRRYALPSLRDTQPSPAIRATASIDHGTDYGAIDETGRWRYAHEVGVEALFDLEADATGATNVLGEHPERAAELIDRIEAWAFATEKIPLMIEAHDGASWDGEIAHFDGAGRIELSGWDVLRTPGGGSWALSFGVEGPAANTEATPLVSQAGTFSLFWDEAGKLNVRMGDDLLTADWPASRACHGILVQTLEESRRGSPHMIYRLYVDGALAAQRRGRVALAPPQMGAPTVIGQGGAFRGRILRPTILNSPLLPAAAQRLAREACGPFGAVGTTTPDPSPSFEPARSGG